MERLLMNDRFITLALDAGLLNYVEHETPRHYFISGNAEQEDVEKFAELIVRECSKIADDNFNKGLCPVGNYIKQHFGVDQ